MTLYNNLRQDAAIRCVELPPDSEGNAFFFHVDAKADKEAVKTWLTSEAGQEIVSDTKMGDHALIVTRSTKKCDEFLAAAKQNGDDFQVPIVKKKFNPWAWRGYTSILGQSLQLTSSFMTKSGTAADRVAIGGFAVSNLIANITNITVGSQKKSDPHQLRMLKEEFNKKFAPYMPPGETPPGVEEKRAELRNEPEKTRKEKAKEMVRQYSVSGGEIGLRVFGATSLAFPVTKLIARGKALVTGSAKGTHDSLKNPNPVTYKAGLWTLLGKFISLCSKEPDPYNPKPPSLLDKIREKVTFRLSSVVETIGAYMMMMDRFKNQKIEISGRQIRDYPGGIGNAVFIGGYAVRLFAPYGSLEVNMKELNAHLSDCLAKIPREKLPEVLAQTAIDLKHHFKEKAPDVSKLYLDLAMDLKQQHNIELPATRSLPVPKEETPVRQFASDDLKKSQKPMPPPLAYQERVAASDSAPVAGIAS